MRSVDPDHRAARQATNDLDGDFAVTAAEVEDALVALERQAPEALLRHPLLKRRHSVVGSCVPFGHWPLLSGAASHAPPPADSGQGTTPQGEPRRRGQANDYHPREDR